MIIIDLTNRKAYEVTKDKLFSIKWDRKMQEMWKKEQEYKKRLKYGKSS